MDQIKKSVAFLNPGQVPVIAADQPLYALAKQIQWHWPEKYGEDKFVIMFGGLHIEMAALRSIGTFLQGSGWTAALGEAGVASSGSADSFLSASHVTKTRKAHQVSACSLYKLMKTEYTNYCNGLASEEKVLSFDDWHVKRREESPQFLYWNLVLEMELSIFTLIRSFREADFDLYCDSLFALTPFFFVNNNVNYARWISIHLRDMVDLEHTHPDIYKEFRNGNFVVHKTKRMFSGLAIDQAHEQNNAMIKSDSGAIGLTEDPVALRRWMVAGPEVSRLLTSYEEASCKKDARTENRHHEQTFADQKSFFENMTRLTAVFTEMGNPFMEESTDMFALDTKDIANPAMVDLLRTHHQRGKDNFTLFRKRMESKDGDIYMPIKKNSVSFFKQEKNVR